MHYVIGSPLGGYRNVLDEKSLYQDVAARGKRNVNLIQTLSAYHIHLHKCQDAK